jgi:CHAT domain-containing protein
VEYQRQLGLDLHVPLHRSPLNIVEIERRLAPDQVVLDYHVTDDESFLWVITSKGSQLFHLPSHLELHYMLDAYNNEIQSQRSIEDSPEGQKLYTTLIQPAEKLIPRGAHVSIIPSKILWLLNFETLIVPGPKPHYWIEDVTVQNCSALSHATTAVKNSRPRARQMLLIGAPEEVNPAFPTLKHANEEIDKVKSHFSSAQEEVISGAGATPQAYLSSRPQQYRLIHFVTHGIPNEKIPMESAIILSGANSSYKLYARDIITQPVHADLVTISACYGAGTRWYIAEGMVGLGWAFIRSGARQVIAALWEVDDSTTPAMMNILYTELGRHRTAADALRTAKLAMLHSNGPQRLPYFWGSLQLYTRS